jgi:hypothetical protein
LGLFELGQGISDIRNSDGDAQKALFLSMFSSLHGLLTGLTPIVGYAISSYYPAGTAVAGAAAGAAAAGAAQAFKTYAQLVTMGIGLLIQGWTFYEGFKETQTVEQLLDERLIAGYQPGFWRAVVEQHEKQEEPVRDQAQEAQAQRGAIPAAVPMAQPNPNEPNEDNDAPAPRARPRRRAAAAGPRRRRGRRGRR